MQRRNIQDEEKDGYSDIVDEMQVTIGFSNTVLIDAEGAGCSSMKTERKKYANSRRHPGYYRRELQG
jgi:hypothetical protein